jgi:hypothetical protein
MNGLSTLDSPRSVLFVSLTPVPDDLGGRSADLCEVAFTPKANQLMRILQG